jgi:hypothetical protein
LIFSGWFGEWSYFISLIRAIKDIVRSGSLAYPIPNIPSLDTEEILYGISWGTEFYRGTSNQTIIAHALQNGLAIAILVGLLWFFIEYLKGRKI